MRLSENALKVLKQCNGKTSKEIANEVGLSTRQVQRYIKMLMDMGLVGKAMNRYFKRNPRRT